MNKNMVYLANTEWKSPFSKIKWFCLHSYCYKKSVLFLLLIILSVFLAGCDQESKEETKRPYSENTDYDEKISNALHKLNKNQRLMLIFGANWCPTCRRLDASMNQPEISKYLNKAFIIIKVNIGNFEKNLHIAHRYNLPIKQGIPAIVIINGNNTVSAYLKTRELSKLHKKGRNALYKRLKEI